MADILGHASLGTNLVSYWKLDETSGTRYDSHGKKTLTDNNTVGSTTGIISNGADFINANTEYLSRSAETFGLGNTWSASLWAKCDNVAVNPRIFHVNPTSGSANQIMFLFQNVSTGYFYVQITNSAGSASKIYKFLPASISTLTHYVVTWDGTTLSLYENGSLKTPVKDSDGSVTQTDTSRVFTLGSTISGSATLDGTMDEVAIWSKALTSTEVTALYNSGAGLPYIDASDVANSYLDTNNVSFWELEETSGTRTDSKGSNDLTDNNTVLSGTGIQGTGADFESSNSEYLSISDAAQTGIDSISAQTVACWVKFESTSANMSPMSKGNDGSNGLFQFFWLTSNNLIFRRVTSSGLQGATASWTPSTATWYHIAGTFDTTNGTVLYVNGVPIGTDSNTLSAIDTTEQFTIGMRSRGGVTFDMYMDGLVDEAGYWSRALSLGEIQALYNGGTGIPYAAATPSTFTPKVMMF